MAAKAIAIIDDEVDLVDLFQEALENNGFKVSTFIDPIQEYWLILSDYHMPKLNGHELCTKLIQLNPKLQVILISAFDTIECDTSKFTFIKKPILIAQLVQIVRNSLAGNTSQWQKKFSRNVTQYKIMNDNNFHNLLFHFSVSLNYQHKRVYYALIQW